MIKSKITRRLSLYFAAALLAFALIVGGVFFALFQRQTMETHRNELLKYAQSLSGLLSGTSGMGGMGGYGAYLRFIGEVSDTDIWVVDQNGEFLSVGMGGMSQMGAAGRVNTGELPQEAGALLRRVLGGETVSSEDANSILSASALTVGVPITTVGGTVAGAVLMHSPVDDTSAAVSRGFLILLISMLIALGAAVLLSVRLSVSFTKPLSRMKATALALTGEDYTARSDIRQDDEIGELSGTLDLLAARLEEAGKERQKLDLLRREFTANISHELRTPVTVIRGSLEALCDGVITDPGKIAQYHAEMLSESKHLERLVNDLLELSRLQNTDFAMEMSRVNPEDVLADAVRSAARLAQSKGITVEFFSDGTLAPFNGDYGRLRQMLLIVLDNAVKFSPAGGAVTVTADSSRITVRDCGLGIPPEQLPYIFDRFYKTRSEQNSGGTGLGLAIAREIASRHGIEISAANRPDGGAEFAFILPREKSNGE